MDMEHHFAQLRELLTHPVGHAVWMKELWELLKEAHQFDPEYYQDIWIPYCEQHKTLFASSFNRLYSLSTFEEAAQLAPFLSFSLHLENFAEEHSMGDEGLRVIAASSYLIHLEELTLSNHAISDEGLLALMTSPYITNLLRLALPFNSIGEEGAQALAHSEALNNLQELNLACNQMCDGGALVLSESTGLFQLQSLRLDENEISDKGLHALLNSAQLPELQSLWLHNNPIQHKDVQTPSSLRIYL